MNRRSNRLLAMAAACLLAPGMLWAAGNAPGKPATQPAAAEAPSQPGNVAARDYYLARYRNYTPGFLAPGQKKSDERSSEKSFDNLSVLNEDSRR